MNFVEKTLLFFQHFHLCGTIYRFRFWKRLHKTLHIGPAKERFVYNKSFVWNGQSGTPVPTNLRGESAEERFVYIKSFVFKDRRGRRSLQIRGGSLRKRALFILNYLFLSPFLREGWHTAKAVWRDERPRIDLLFALLVKLRVSKGISLLSFVG